MTLANDANTNELNEITSNFLEEFQDKETRHIYVDDFLNTKIATQIKALREQRGWTQEELAERVGMRQERISLLENVNYESWTLSVLRRLAEAFDLRINVSFEDFGSYLQEFSNFSRKSLERNSFADDPAFKIEKAKPKPKLKLVKPKASTTAQQLSFDWEGTHLKAVGDTESGTTVDTNKFKRSTMQRRVTSDEESQYESNDVLFETKYAVAGRR